MDSLKDGGIITMRIPYGTTGLELHRDVSNAEVLESAIGTLKAQGS